VTPLALTTVRLGVAAPQRFVLEALPF